MVNLLVAPCWVMSVKISCENNAGSSVRVQHYLSDGGLDFIQRGLYGDFFQGLENRIAARTAFISGTQFLSVVVVVVVVISFTLTSRFRDMQATTTMTVPI
jgi:hypothetical protein